MTARIDEATPQEPDGVEPVGSADQEQAAERAHLTHLEAAIEARRPEALRGAGRGYAKQAKRRDVEQAARRRVVEHLREAESRGVKRKEVARELGVSVRTLTRWDQRYEESGIQAVRRGRPTRRSSGADRNRVILALKLFGPQTGVATLRWLYPEMARGELADILHRYRAHELREKAITRKSLERRLHWTRLGAVWSMDHTDPSAAVDGERRVVLSVGDLASGAQLLWEAQVGARAELVAGSLERLFEEHGAPLIMKSDNGSAFVAEEVRELLWKWKVIPLWSPPYTPRYNGSRESDIRWGKARTENLACQRGSRNGWSEEDLVNTRDLTNCLPKRPTKGAPSRGEVFSSRERITLQERAWFRTAVAEEEMLERATRRISIGTPLPRKEQAKINRQAIRRALVARGLLKVQKRRVSLTITSIFRARIW